MYFNRKIFDCLWKIMVLVIVASLLLACICDELVKTYLASLLIAFLPGIAVAVYMSWAMSRYLRKQNADTVLQYYWAIRQCIIRIKHAADDYKITSDQPTRDLRIISIRDWCTKIQTKYDAVLLCELFDRLHGDKLPTGLVLIFKFFREIKQRIDAPIYHGVYYQQSTPREYVDNLIIGLAHIDSYLEGIDKIIMGFAHRHLSKKERKKVEKLLAKEVENE
jgi:hypothetical protein